jgi:hypothetical protein
MRFPRRTVRAAELETRKLFRCVCRAGKCWGDGVTERLAWHVVKQYAAELGFRSVAPHDLRQALPQACREHGETYFMRLLVVLCAAC